ncbi:MAG: hypothetical protein EXR05_07350 [Acetobacteraceae bacterium]|nr:hypothetical protein [Acetobacteraceae bacterium]
MRPPTIPANTPAIQKLLQDAMAHHQAGRRTQAEAGYHAILRQGPDHPGMLHLLGVLAHEGGASTRKPAR